MRRIVSLAPVLLTLAAVAPASAGSRILFAGDTLVPRSVQEFAWHVIETRCQYQANERDLRSFWAHRTGATSAGAGITYSIAVLSDLAWKKTEPPATIEMTVVDDGGRLRLTALTSSFVVCAARFESR
jgi:hypothetical protein